MLAASRPPAPASSRMPRSDHPKAPLVTLISPEVLELVEEPTPEVGPDDVMVEVEAAGASFVDGLIVKGKYQIRPELPTPAVICWPTSGLGLATRYTRPRRNPFPSPRPGGF